ncbi:3-hydroxyisobutyrate dehydrogenase [Paenibacillus tianmuensis]|uniref:3-hydroxyisobutyrate dehydrogenase n=1 Tax=Paenibacillus tianmuensis TaxID=624147 RepID=A0A1G4T4G8_9BACL|nr:NAD(P)-binding domain-containing protein [Paenibacillus tianmuensis]SCW76340.1 3-hydroxyisobutyrate dehydrogenase [Paenibacillus tianmuensis]
MAKITVVGCGIMGSAIVNAFLVEKHTVTIVDTNEAATKPFVERRATYASQLSDALDSDFILLNLPNHKIVESILHSLPSGSLSGKIIVNTTTATPKDVRAVDKMLTDEGALYLDAAIECYPAEIGKEKGYLFYSGSAEAFAKTKDALSALAAKSEYLGENVVGATVMDLAIINTHYGMVASMLEGVALCIKNDIPVETYINQAKAIAPLAFDSPLRQISTDLLHYTGEFVDANEATLEIETNALASIVQALRDSGVKTELSETILKMMEGTIAKGYGNKNFTSIISEIL